MNDKKIVNKVIDRIKNNNIKPRGSWWFILKNFLIWFFAFLSLVISSISFSIVILLSKNINVSFCMEMQTSFVKTVFLTVPYFWIIFLALFIFLVYRQIRKTKRGYLYPLKYIIFLSFAISLFLGSIIYSTGLSKKIDEFLSYEAPLYRELINPQINFWFAPEKGRLLGLVNEKHPETNSLTVVDIDGKYWNVQVSPNSNLNIIPTEKPLRFVGRKINENEFMVYKIAPFSSGRGHFHQGAHHMRSFNIQK